MKFTKTKRALYICINKNTDEIYIERIEVDNSVFETIIKKAKQIINATVPLERLSDDPNYYECKWCDFNSLCHGTSPAHCNCRTCTFATPLESKESLWECSRHNIKLGPDKTIDGCSEHLFIPDLIPYAEPIDGDADQGWIKYKLGTGEEFYNVAASGFDPNVIDTGLPRYPSQELQNITNPEVIKEPMVDAARRILNGKIEGTK